MSDASNPDGPPAGVDPAEWAAFRQFQAGKAAAATPPPPPGVNADDWSAYVARQREAQMQTLDQAKALIAKAGADIPPPSASELLIMQERARVKAPGNPYGMRAAGGTSRGGLL